MSSSSTAATIAAPSVKMFDYRQQLAAIRDEILTAVAEVLDSGQLVLGSRVNRFEENFSRWLGGPGESIGVGNGTDAIALALKALGVGLGHEVITVANTAIPTVSAIRMTGATPVFCDIHADTLLMNVDDVAKRITPRTRAIVPVHLFGNAVELDALVDLAQRNRLALVEDCAQSTGTRYRGAATGTRGDVACYSFYPTKNLGAYGDGGLCYTANAELAATLRRLRFYGCGQTYYAEQEGVNSRLDELHAAMLDVKLKYLDAWIARRRDIAALYDRLLGAAVWRPRVAGHVEHSYHLYVISVEARDALIAQLKAAGVGCGIHYPTPIHRMRGYAFLGYAPDSLPQTEQAANRILSLPCYPELTDDEVHRVAECILHRE